MLDYKYAKLACQKAQELLAVDSPTGFTSKISKKVFDEFFKLGFEVTLTNKGAVLVTIGGFNHRGFNHRGFESQYIIRSSW